MKPQNQFCTPEQAKELIALGITDKTGFGIYHYNIEVHLIRQRLINDICTPIFSNAELGAALGTGFQVYLSTLRETKGQYYTDNFAGKSIDKFIFFPTEAQCRAFKLIQSLKKGFITAEEANSNLINA